MYLRNRGQSYYLLAGQWCPWLNPISSPQLENPTVLTDASESDVCPSSSLRCFLDHEMSIYNMSIISKTCMGNNSSGMEEFQNRIIFEHNRCKPICSAVCLNWLSFTLNWISFSYNQKPGVEGTWK